MLPALGQAARQSGEAGQLKPPRCVTCKICGVFSTKAHPNSSVFINAQSGRIMNRSGRKPDYNNRAFFNFQEN